MTVLLYFISIVCYVQFDVVIAASPVLISTLIPEFDGSCPALSESTFNGTIFKSHLVNSTVALVLVRNETSDDKSTTLVSSLYRTTDGGITWFDYTPLLNGSDILESWQFNYRISLSIYGIFNMVPSPSDRFTVYLYGAQGHMWVTRDGGETFTRTIATSNNVVLYWIPPFLSPQDSLIPHPNNTQWILGMFVPTACIVGGTCSVWRPAGGGALAYSTSGGASWKISISDCMLPESPAWVMYPIESTIIAGYSQSCTQFSSPYQIYISSDFFLGNILRISPSGLWASQTRWSRDQNIFGFIVTTTFPYTFPSPNQEGAVFYGYNLRTGTLNKAQFPVQFDSSIPNGGRYIRWEKADSAGAIVAVNLNNNFVNTSLSLYVAPTLAGNFTLSLSNTYLLDYQFLPGLPSFIIANKFPFSSIDAGYSSQTVLSVDYGNSWQPIPPPPGEECTLCSLNIVPKTATTGKFSVLALASVGPYYDPSSTSLSTHVYFSKNGGISWKRIRNSAQHLAINNDGNLIVTLDNFNTDVVSFSQDSGNTFSSCFFYDNFTANNTYIVSKVLTGLGLREGVWIETYWTDSDGNPRNSLFSMDLSVPDLPVCGENDYYTWNPLEDTCILGQITTYKIKNSTSFCAPDPPVPTTQNCTTCLRSDFLCATCFTNDPMTNECVFDSTQSGCTSDPRIPPANCVGNFTTPPIYQKKKNTKCTENQIYLDTQTIPCNNSGNSPAAQPDPSPQPSIQPITTPTTTPTPTPTPTPTVLSTSVPSDPSSNTSDQSAGVTGLVILGVIIGLIVIGLVIYFVVRYKERIRLRRLENEFYHDSIEDEAEL